MITRTLIFVATSILAVVNAGAEDKMMNAQNTFLANPEIKQMVMVISDDWDAKVAKQYRFEKLLGEWKSVGETVPVNLGRTGLAWGIGLHPKQTGYHKKEGDGKAPSGIFDFGIAFGYLPELATKMSYSQMQSSHYCIDVNASPLYNQIVDQKQVGESATKGSTEAMRRDLFSNDDLYKKGLVIQHNPDGISGAGSCIFMHLWRGPNSSTAGCTSMHENEMDALLTWLDLKQQPRYVALPRHEYLAKQKVWGLPKIP
jgi:L,D-peptidoglycan transpeptidase YkuD (ErfK/YbiS/YcfS/YnhG family)